MSIPVSQSDLPREWIEKQFDEGKDLSKASYKRKSIKDFVEAHPELSTTEKKVRVHFANILKVAAIKKKSPEEIGIKKPKVNPVMIQVTSDMQATIQPRPQDAQANLAGAPVQQISQIGQPNQPYVNPNMTVESVGALVQGGLTGIKAILPELELLSEQEQKSIGNMWLPSVQRIQDVILQQGLNEVFDSTKNMVNGFPKLINWLDENGSKGIRFCRLRDALSHGPTDKANKKIKELFPDEFEFEDNILKRDSSKNFRSMLKYLPEVLSLIETVFKSRLKNNS